MKYCSNSDCPGRQQNNRPAGYHDSVEVCPDCGAAFTANDRLIRKPSPSPWTKAFITLGVLAVCLGARRIPLPTLTPTAGFGDGMMPICSIMVLGVGPLIAGYMLVEFAALLVPEWRPLRVGNPAGRARLHRAALLIGMFLALPQAVVITVGLESTDVTRNYGAGFRVITVLTLVAATGALVALARLVEHEGLGGGFSLLLLADLVPKIVGPLGNAFSAAQSGAVPYSVLLNGVLIAAVPVGATLWMFSQFHLPASDNFPHPSLVSRPACGVAPFTIVAAIFAAAAAWTRINFPGHALSLEPPGGLPTALLLSTGAAVLFAFLFNRPDRITAIWMSLSPNPPGGIPRLKAVMLESVLFIIIVALAEAWAVQRIGIYASNTVSIILATGIICDLLREWRAKGSDPHLTPVWEIHQTYAVAPAMRLLEAERIRAFAKGTRLRSLLQFFGPYVPVQILVPAADAQRAHALLQARWPRADGNGGK